MEPEEKRDDDPFVAYAAKVTKELRELLNHDIRKVHLRIGEYLDTVRDIELYKKAGFSDFDEWLSKVIGWKPSRARMIVSNHRVLQRLEVVPNSELGIRLREVGWYKLHVLLNGLVAPVFKLPAPDKDAEDDNETAAAREIENAKAIEVITKALDDGLSERAIQSIVPRKRVSTQDADLPKAAAKAYQKLQNLLGEAFKAVKARESKKVEALMPRLISTQKKLGNLIPPKGRRVG